jgi:A/G-specific adenine glycosylase
MQTICLASQTMTPTSNDPEIQSFQEKVYDYYAKHKRSLPWRDSISGYGVFLSEIMLQQTQVARVLIKYAEFTVLFPTFQDLATATLPKVIAAWQGLGYNRRARFLHEAAPKLVGEFGGIIPNDEALVDALPGIGPATASAIVCYTYNRPVVFIETNIRRVFLHHFFRDEEGVPDASLLPFVEACVPQENPRDWYYALMDYGTHLARIVVNPNKRSKHYSVQSKFEGSVRQVRGGILRELTNAGTGGGGSVGVVSQDRIQELFPDERREKALAGLVNDKMIEESDGGWKLRE